MNSLRTYRYISVEKVNGFFNQIEPTLLEQLQAKLTLSAGFAKMDVSQKADRDSIMSRLKVVEDVIDGNGDVGTVNEPARFIRGAMEMSWGEIETHDDITPKVVYFSGRTETTSIGLGGSLGHVQGRGGATKFFGGSCAPFLQEVLEDAQQRQSKGGLLHGVPEQTITDYADPRQLALNYIEGEAQVPGAFTERLEFLAELLVVGTVGDRRAVLASPIYVCAA